MPFTGTKWIDHETDCPSCGMSHVLEVNEWDSSCGGYTDHKVVCTNPECDFKRWYEGPDA
jgi:hypothetical protein